MSQMDNKFFIPAMLALMGVSAGAWADKPDGDPEVTIRLMPHAEVQLPEAVTNPIELPKHLIEDGQNAEKLEGAKKGLENANTRRVAGPNHGLSHAQDARETAQDMAEDAKLNRETRGRSDENRPDRPDQPDRPDRPGPPDSPPGQN